MYGTTYGNDQTGPEAEEEDDIMVEDDIEEADQVDGSDPDDAEDLDERIDE